MYGLPKQLRKMKADVFHGTDFSVPYLPACASVMTVHDLSPWMNPDWHHGAGRIRRRTPLLLRLGLATMVITDCQAVRSAVLSRFHLAEDRVVAIPLAAGAQFKPVALSMPMRKASTEPYLLYVGTLEPRKNIPFLVEAWKQIYDEFGVKLKLVGRRRDDCPPIPQHPGLEFAGEVEDAALPGLYSGAIAVVYPSHYEGFGLPVLEAMACGAPVIASTDAALTELTNGAAIHCDASSPNQWAEAMRTAITQPDRRHDMKDQGLRRAHLFSWQNTARKTREVYQEAIARFHRGGK